MESKVATDDVHALGIDPQILQASTVPPFDLYALGGDGESLRLFRPAHEPIYLNTWERLETEGVERLYIHGDDRERCLDYVQLHLPRLLEQNELPEGHLAQWIYMLTCRAVSRLLGDPEAREHYEEVQGLVQAMVRVVLTHRWASRHMFDCAPVNYNTHTHSVNVAVLLAGFARDVMHVEDRKLLAEIAVGGALHDLGKALVPEEILAKPSKLTADEFARVSRHPRQGVEMSRPFMRRATMAQRIIAQHHENAAGNGYPDGRTTQSIDAFARAARAIDVFDALTSHRPYGPAVTYYRALNTMATDMPGVFDEHVLHRFMRYAADCLHEDRPATVSTEAAAGDGEPAPEETPGTSSPVMAEGPLFRLESEANAHPQQQETEDETALFPLLRTRADAFAELCSQETGDVAMMKGILRALQGAVSEHLQRRPPGTTVHEQPEPASPGRSARRAEVDSVREVFPLVWQLDRWLARLAEPAEMLGEPPPSRREIIEWLGDARERLCRTLLNHHVETIESGQEPGRDAYWISRIHAPAAEAAQRVGFLYRNGAEVEVLEPARAARRADLRKTG